MQLTDLQQALKTVTKIAVAAGAVIDAYYKNDSAEVWIKKDRTPVTDADIAAHRYIKQALAAFTPFPIVSEESSEVATLISASYYWLVDPLDGTKEFIAHTDEFTVNIALIHQGRPVLGVVYAPVDRTLYYACENGGAYQQKSGQPPVLIKTRPFNAADFVFVISRRHSRDDLSIFTEKWPGCRVEELGSSLKFCKIATGAADLYIRRGATSEWDTAAAQCVVEQAGGKVVTLHDVPLVYNKGQLYNPEFLACGDLHFDVRLFT